MARRNVRMEEYLELVYQWHRGRSSREIRDSLQISRKTLRKYLRLFRARGLSRDKPLPPEEELARMVASVVKVAVFEQPVRERIHLYHQQIQDWFGQPHMTIQQVRRLLEEQHELKVSYMSVYRYVRQADDRQALERLAAYILRPSFAATRLRYQPGTGQVLGSFAQCLSPGRGAALLESSDLYRTAKGVARSMDALDWIAQVVSHIPDPGAQMVRYYGWYSNASRGKRRGVGQAAAAKTSSHEPETEADSFSRARRQSARPAAAQDLRSRPLNLS